MPYGSALTHVSFTHQPLCLPHLLMTRSQHIPDAFAILAPGRSALTYAHLQRHVHATVQALYAMGLRRHDRVAVVLPNGPEMAVACLAVASCTTCMPLNPLYTANEFAFYLGELHVQALVVQAGLDSPAREVATTYGLQIVELYPRYKAAAGLFMFTDLGSDMGSQQVDLSAYTQPDDVAFVMHTSGTTSQPKSVPLTHVNVCSSAVHACSALDLTENDRYLNVLPLFHVGGLISGLIASLMAGASVVCPPDFDAPKFFEWFIEFRPTWYMGVSVIHQAILAHASRYREVIAHSPLRFIRSPAAALSSKVLTELESTFSVPVLRSYGVTEATLVSCNPLPPRQRKPDSVGVSAGPEIAIMDPRGELLPIGKTGEVVIRGPNVMQGYENDPVANRESFKHGWFRTGDQGFLDADGYLFITGRLKELINRGGEIIAPQEVDDVLMEHPSVVQAVTFGVPHVRWEEDVMTAVVIHPDIPTTEQDLRRFVASRLAPFKVPSQIHLVERIPVGSTGKPQRHRLAERFGLLTTPQRVGHQLGDPAPRTPLEELLVGLWATMLGCEEVGVYDDFFRLGGDSLLATQLLSRIRDVTHVDVSFRQFFNAPTVVDIARYIATARQSAPRLSTPSLHAMPRDAPLPLSYAQQRLWFLEQLGLSRHAYNLLEAMRLRGFLRIETLVQSLQAIGRRHEVLRTTFTSIDGQPFQIVGPATRLPISVVDLQELSQQEQEAQVYRLAQAEVRRPFDLGQGPLLRVTLVRLSDMEHVLLLTMHHIVTDRWSDGVLWRELTVLYNALITGQPSSLPVLAIQYADFSHWQKQWMQGDMLATQLDYWRQRLTEISTLQLPIDHPRPAVQTFRGARYFLTLPPSLTDALKVLSQQHGVTLFMTLLAAFQTLLHRYTGQDDIVVGSLIANRNRVELEGLIGFFVNTLALRTDLSGDPSFQELLIRVRDVTLGAYENQDVPYEKLLEALRLPRDLSHNPLFQVMLVLHNTPQQVPELPGLEVQALEIDPGTARFDLTLEFWETSAGLRGCFEYSTDLFEVATITRMGEYLKTLLEGIVANPEQRLSRLPLLPEDELRRLLVDWNATTKPYPDDQCLHRAFESLVTRMPDAVAIVCGDESLTYRELNSRANQLAHYLLALGVKTETLVGLCIERSLAMVVGLLGILKAGAAYLPLDPTYPSERLAFMLEDAQLPVVLTLERLAPFLSTHGTLLVCLDRDWAAINEYGDDNPAIEVSADNLAYVLYTSGSSGKPKGVLGVHRATLNALFWMWRTFPFDPHDVCCQKTSISFGDSIQELFGPLLQGIRLILIPDEILKDFLRFVQVLAWHRVTRLILVPSLLRALLDAFRDLQDRLPNLRLWFAGGEALSSDLCRRFRERLHQGLLVNLYGASEASDDTTWYDTSLLPDECTIVPIGRPIANMQVYVLDPHLQPVPIGVPGELYVSGVGLSRGYLYRPELTTERFIPHPFSHELGARLYKTGDVVRYRSDGNLEFVGRSDDQIKLRGVRMELGEIEAVLVQHAAVQETIVSVREDIPGEPRLVAYVVPAQVLGPSSGELRRFLEAQLPMAMVPTVFVTLDTLPHTPSGKVDRRALPEPTSLRPDLKDRYVAPRDVREEQVAAIWRQLLGLDRVGIYDDFFELGGHSLLAIQLLFRVQDITYIKVPLLRFFEAPTVVGIAAFIATKSKDEQGQQAPAIASVPRNGALLASIAQEHFWYFDQALPGLSLFNVPYTIRLRGELNVMILEQSFNEMIRRHEALRTTFALENGQLIQIVGHPLSMSLAVHDLRTLPRADREAEVHRLVQEEGRQPFDLRQGPLLQGCLIRLGDQEHILLVVLHHIICDGWSLGVFIRELAVLYDAFANEEPSPLPVLPIQYADFATWQRQGRHDSLMESQLAYWRAQLHDPLPVLELPTDHPRGTGLALRTARQNFAFSGAMFEALTCVSRREGSTLFMMCLAAFKILLYGYTGQEDVVVATLVANRTRRETEGLIGFLVNTVLLRTDLGGNPTVLEVLQRVRVTTKAGYAHQDLPFESLVRVLEGERNLERASLCQVMVIWQNALVQTEHFPKRTVFFEAIEQNVGMLTAALTTFDIVLTLRETPEGINGMCIYKTDLFETETISRMLGDFQDMLTCLSTWPERGIETFR